MLEEFSFDSAQETKGLKDQGVASSELDDECHNKRQVTQSPSLASLKLLSNYASRFKKLRIQDITNSNKSQACVDGQKLSAEEIVRVAGARYVQFSADWYDDFSIPMHPYDHGFGVGVLSEEENRDIELAQFLLAAAERVGCHQYERASRLLLHCLYNSSPSAKAVERVIFHFAQALGERIEKEAGMCVLEEYDKNIENELIQKLDTNIAIKCHQKIPFNQVMQFTAVQAIVEHVASYTKIHFIDLDIRRGIQWTCLMQALAERDERPVVLLKITAIGITGKTEIEETGKRLASFAKSLNLPFSFKQVFVRDMVEIREQHFEIEDDEVVAVYAPYILRTMVSRPDCLENLMGLIRNMKPVVMIVLEVEANHNSSCFVNRFVEALFFYSAFFDCIEACLKEENESRMTVEVILTEGIRNIVAAEGRERTVRNVKIDVWRRFFARYRMVELGFSESSLYQANLVAKEFSKGDFCTLHKNGKCLMVGWKGTPMHALSAWRSSHLPYDLLHDYILLRNSMAGPRIAHATLKGPSVVKELCIGFALALAAGSVWKMYHWNEQRKVRTFYDLLEKGVMDNHGLKRMGKILLTCNIYSSPHLFLAYLLCALVIGKWLVEQICLGLGSVSFQTGVSLSSPRLVVRASDSSQKSHTIKFPRLVNLRSPNNFGSGRIVRSVRPVRAAPEGISEKVEESIKKAEEACAGGAADGECAAAWDEVEELSAAASHARDKKKESDPLEEFCKDNPETRECRTDDN
ncbi:DELLA protein RGL1-like [Senna tora]|uniref:DELLA protein RGL1-like n=1 Tax=Senna tora TaxID=362788 RepID=A0A834WIC5_9FABA|nr:DELLA protein RGL1-like [Senna tora]